jgi:putative FmdB family regulatory protein
MPIYAYKCSDCGHAKDVLQKISDDPLTVCPACGAAAFSKQVTAAGFQLKGAGWYVTDFRAGGDGANSGVGKAADPSSSDSPKTDAPAATPAAAPAASTAAPAASPSPAPAPAPAATKSVASPAAS